MTKTEFLNKALLAAGAKKTLYVMGCFGAPMTESNKERYSHNHSYNEKPDRQAKIQAASSDTFGFDCVCLIKGILWGWDGDASAIYGGADYIANGVPDFTISAMESYCTLVSRDFTKIEPGDVLFLGTDHCGIYLGDGKAVESTPSWKDGVQVTALGNIGSIDGYMTRSWDKWGRLKFLEQTEYYIVQRGDTLSRIAYRFNTTWQKIKELNGLKNANLIYVGQRLRVK